jgi:hypothetical protein
MRGDGGVQLAILDLASLRLIVKMRLGADAIMFTQILLAAPEVV